MSDQYPLLKPVGKKLAVLVVAPWVVIITLVLLLSQGIHGYPLAVCNADQGFEMPMAGHVNIPANLVKALDPKAFDIRAVSTPAEAQALYDSGAVKALLVFPAEMTEDMMIKLDDPTYVLPERITLQVNEANPLARLLVMSTIGRSSLAAMQESGGGLSTDSLPIPLDLSGIIKGFEPAPTYLLVALLMFVCFVLTGIISYLSALEMRGYRSLLATGPVRHPVVFALVFSLAGLVLFLLLLITISAILGLSLGGPVFAALPVVWLLLAVAPALTFAAGLGAPEIEKSRPVIPFLILPLFFGGFLFPIELLPVWLQWMKFIFPAYYGINGALSVALQQGSGPAALQIAATGVWLLAFLGLGALVLKGQGKAASSGDTASPSGV